MSDACRPIQTSLAAPQVPQKIMSRRGLASASAVAIGLMSAAGETGVPMTFGVLTTNSVEEALARAEDGRSNKGWEAAAAALEMAAVALENDTASADVKSLARQIEAAQDPEIQVMKGWLSRWGAQESSGPMDHGPGGMMSDEDMDALKAASGADFDQMWLRMMIEHHQGAVTMAQDVLAATDDADVKKLANAVVTGQQEEIATMQGMIGGS